VRVASAADAVGACVQHTIILSDRTDINDMPVTREELEAAIRETIQVTHVEVEDNSSGCGENFSVLIVSKVVDTNCEPLGRH
jgi:hypothetical protein